MSSAEAKNNGRRVRTIAGNRTLRSHTDDNATRPRVDRQTASTLPLEDLMDELCYRFCDALPANEVSYRAGSKGIVHGLRGTVSGDSLRAEWRESDDMPIGRG